MNITSLLHTVDKQQLIDVLGYIGNLTINDTTDFRFAEYFKQKPNDDRWLIDGILHQVDLPYVKEL